MSITSVKSFDQKYQLIDCAQFPECPRIDPKIIGPKKFPPLFSMRSRAQELNAMIHEFKDVKEHQTRTKILGCLKVAGLAAVLAGVILAGIFIPGVAIAVPVAMILSVVYLTLATVLFYDTTGIELEGTHYFAPLIAAFASLILPICEAFTRTSRLEKRLESKAAPIWESIQRDANVCRNELEQYELLQGECINLTRDLDKRIEANAQLLEAEERCIALKTSNSHIHIEETKKRMTLLVENREAVQRVLEEFVDPKITELKK